MSYAYILRKYYNGDVLYEILCFIFTLILIVSHHGIMENRLFLCRSAHIFTGLTKVHVLVVNIFLDDNLFNHAVEHIILLIVVKSGTYCCLVSL